MTECRRMLVDAIATRSLRPHMPLNDVHNFGVLGLISGKPPSAR